MTDSRWVLQAAEDHFLHGHLLSSWIVDYVDFEESLAIGSIAQEEFAHAATLFRLDGMDEAARDDYVFERPLTEWHPTGLLDDAEHEWPSTVLRGLLLAHAAVVRSERLGESEDQAHRDTAAVLVAEQHLHVAHWERWVRLLGSDERTADPLRNTAAMVLPRATDIFGEREGDIVGQDHVENHARWVTSVGTVLEEVQVPLDDLGRFPTQRLRASERPGLVRTLDRVRQLRVGSDDGVRGLYR